MEPTKNKFDKDLFLIDIFGNLIAQHLYDSIHNNSEQINKIEAKLDLIIKMLEEKTNDS